MKRIRLNQITDENNVINTTSLTKFEERVYEFKNNIKDIIDTGLCGNFNKTDFESEMRKLSYFVDTMFVMSDEDFEKFEENESDEFAELLN